LRKLKISAKKVNVVSEFVRILENIREKKATERANTTNTTARVEPVEHRRMSRKVKFALRDSLIKRGLSRGASNLSEELLQPSGTVTRSAATQKATVDSLTESGKEHPQQQKYVQRIFTKHGYSRSVSLDFDERTGKGNHGHERAPNARNLLNPFRHVRQLVKRGLSINGLGDSHSDKTEILTKAGHSK
jgi:hypothetical protein